MTTQLQVMPPKVDLIDQRTNKISREWYLFLLRDFERGGATEASIAALDTRVDAIDTDLTAINASIAALNAALLAMRLPVGAIHVTVDPTNPATTLGYGTWAAFGTGRVIVGVDVGDADFDTVEETGGSKTATI